MTTVTPAGARGLDPGTIDLWLADEDASESTRVLESVLAHYRVDGGSRLECARDLHGRPFVRGGALRVSVSHTAGLMLVAVCARGRVGVDVERARSGPWLQLPGHSLTPGELAGLREVEALLQDEAFLGFWTRKEALLKASGLGLSVDPRLIELSGPGEPSRVLAVPPELGAPGDWSIVVLELAGYVAALAADLPPVRVRTRRLCSAVATELVPG